MFMKESLRETFEKLVLHTKEGEIVLASTNPAEVNEGGDDYEVGELHFIGVITRISEVGHCDAPGCKEVHPLDSESLFLGSGRANVQVKSMIHAIQVLAAEMDESPLDLMNNLMMHLLQSGIIDPESIKVDVASRIKDIVGKGLKRKSDSADMH